MLSYLKLGMGWFEFISSVVSSTAWPIVALMGILAFKRPILEAIPRLQKLKYKELEAEFSRELDKIEVEAKVAGLEATAEVKQDNDFEQALQQISEISPDAAIVEAFRRIERSAKELIDAIGAAPDYNVAAPYKMIERILETSGALGTREVKIFGDLRQLRNKITHTEFTSTKKQAHDYIELTAMLISKMDQATKKKKLV